MQNQARRSALVLLTDGVVYKDPTSIDTAIEFAQRADIIIYFIRFSDPIAIGPLKAAFVASMKEHGKLELERIAKETGGVSYGVTKNQSIEAIYTQIEEALRNQYSIGYTPGRPVPDGKFHRIKLITKDRHLVVIASPGARQGDCSRNQCSRGTPFRQLEWSVARLFRKSLCNLIPRIERLLQGEVRFDSLLDLVKRETEFTRRTIWSPCAESG